MPFGFAPLTLALTVGPACPGPDAAALRVPRGSAGPAMNLQLAPPPPPTVHNGGGGGGGGDKDEFLRVVEPDEEELVIQDWISRSRIYKMTEDAELHERHSNAQQVMESLLSCAEDPGCELDGAYFDEGDEYRSAAHKVTLGLYDENESVHAIAGAEISEAGELVVNLLALNPVELNRSTSTAALRILSGIRALAEQIEVKLNLEPLKHINKGRYWLTGVALLSAGGDVDGR